jgi:hypothetical protein
MWRLFRPFILHGRPTGDECCRKTIPQRIHALSGKAIPGGVEAAAVRAGCGGRRGFRARGRPPGSLTGTTCATQPTHGRRPQHPPSTQAASGPGCGRPKPRPTGLPSTQAASDPGRGPPKPRPARAAVRPSRVRPGLRSTNPRPTRAAVHPGLWSIPGRGLTGPRSPTGRGLALRAPAVRVRLAPRARITTAAAVAHDQDAPTSDKEAPTSSARKRLRGRDHPPTSPGRGASLRRSYQINTPG